MIRIGWNNASDPRLDSVSQVSLLFVRRSPSSVLVYSFPLVEDVDSDTSGALKRLKRKLAVADHAPDFKITRPSF